MSDYSDLYGHPLVRSPLACRIGYGVSEVAAERKREVMEAAESIEASQPGMDATAVLLMALLVGPEVMPIAGALSVDAAFVASCAARLVEAGIWCGNVMEYPWLEADDAEAEAGIALDSLVATGQVEKLPDGTYRLAEVVA